MMTMVPMACPMPTRLPCWPVCAPGKFSFTFDSVTSSIRQIRAGKTRALAVKTAVRPDALPEVPTLGDFVTEYEASGWLGFWRTQEYAC